MLKQGKGPSAGRKERCSLRTVCEDNKKEATTTDRKAETLSGTSSLSCYLHQQQHLPAAHVTAPVPSRNCRRLCPLIRTLRGLRAESVLPTSLFLWVTEKRLLPLTPRGLSLWGPQSASWAERVQSDTHLPGWAHTLRTSDDARGSMPLGTTARGPWPARGRAVPWNSHTGWLKVL